MNLRNSLFARFATFVTTCSRTTTYLLMLLVACFPGTLLGLEKVTQARLDAIGHLREVSIQQELKPLDRVSEQYKEALQQYKGVAQGKGDLDGVVAVNKALESFNKRSAFGPLSAAPQVAKIQQNHQKAYNELKQQLEVRVVTVERDHSKQLQELVKELTQAGMTEDALEVRKIREKFIEDFKAARAVDPQVSGKPLATSLAKFEGSRAGEERDFEIASGVKVKMCWVPPGEFVMGSPEGELGRRSGETQHRVSITKGFWLGKYEVTQAQWQAVMGNAPSKFKGKDQPVESVSWNMIAGVGGFLEKVNKKATSGARFHLPTEAQWEYACRAGTQTSLYSGKNLTSGRGHYRNLDGIAWYNANSDGKTHPVGKKKANAWGLHDMHGNVWEWCADWKGNYPTEPSVDPKGPDVGSDRVFRGGCWHDNASRSSVTIRDSLKPNLTDNRHGFRVTLNSSP